VPLLVDEEIVGLHVAMHPAFSMEVEQRLGALLDDLRHQKSQRLVPLAEQQLQVGILK
jgi:hypothetical protein